MTHRQTRCQSFLLSLELCDLLTGSWSAVAIVGYWSNKKAMGGCCCNRKADLFGSCEVTPQKTPKEKLSWWVSFGAPLCDPWDKLWDSKSCIDFAQCVLCLRNWPFIADTESLCSLHCFFSYFINKFRVHIYLKWKCGFNSVPRSFFICHSLIIHCRFFNISLLASKMHFTLAAGNFTDGVLHRWWPSH